MACAFHGTKMPQPWVKELCASQDYAWAAALVAAGAVVLLAVACWPSTGKKQDSAGTASKRKRDRRTKHPKSR